jgi:hypothetical protein
MVLIRNSQTCDVRRELCATLARRPSTNTPKQGALGIMEIAGAIGLEALDQRGVSVAALMSFPRALQWGFLTAWMLIGTPLGWYGVLITSAIGALYAALYGALAHRVIASADEAPPLARLADATRAP